MVDSIKDLREVSFVHWINLVKIYKMSSNYISVIKINNKPILPPLITFDKHKELRRYKKQAIKVEKRLERERTRLKDYKSSRNLSDKKVSTNACEIPDYKKEYLKNLTCDIQAESYVDNEFVDINTHIKELKPNKIQLSRSNSYILENPSPMLLEYIRKNNLTEKNQSFLCNEIEDELSKIRANDNDSCIDHCLDTSCTETELNNLSDESRPVTALTDNDNKIKQFMYNNVPNINENVKVIEPIEVPSSISEVLEKIPEEYSSRIKEFLANEKLEAKKRMQDYIKHTDGKSSSKSLLKEFNESRDLMKFSTPIDDKTPIDCTIFYSVIGENGNTDSALEDGILDFSYEQPDDINNIPCILEEQQLKKASDVNLESQQLTREQAASVIQAGVRGYLTRRLLRTEKVQDLKNVIKEALLCAVQLHSENIESISESDVELHRRLMKQVITGCYSFNEVFFDTPVKEQMLIISMDRQMKLERLKKVVKGASNKSTPRNRVSSLSQVSSITV